MQKLISKSRITDLRNGGQHSYVSARRLFWVIRELQTVGDTATTNPRIRKEMRGFAGYGYRQFREGRSSQRFS